jgi:hypothetical protein
MRGKLTEAVQDEALAELGREITQAELRLMPYIQWVMMNNQRLEPNKIHQGEREILATWRKEGYIEGGASGLAISKEFWDAINQILWHSYVAPLCEHVWHFVKDWEGDPDVPNGTNDLSHWECKLCDQESIDVPEGVEEDNQEF